MKRAWMFAAIALLPIDTSRFVSGVKLPTSLPRQVACTQPIRGAVVNHHVLAADVMSEVLGRIAKCAPKNATIIILSPDHYSQSISPVALGSLPYTFGRSRLGIDQNALQTLAKLPFAKTQGELFRIEHGVGALVPFLAPLRPDLKIVPVAVRRDITDENLAKLVSTLKTLSSRGNILLVSSDMSHYLFETAALENDKQTMDAFSKNASSFFASADDDFTDNGRSLAAVIRALGNPVWHQLSHSISSEKNSSPFFTTSYITGYWTLRK